MSIFLLLSSAFADTLTVGSSGQYSTIQDAVSASSSGDTIDVQAGTYSECIIISGKSLTFSGSNVTLNGSCTDAQVYLDSSASLSVDGWTISTSGRGFYVADATSSLTVFNLEMSGCGSSSVDGAGFYVEGGSLIIDGGSYSSNTGDQGGVIRASDGATIQIRNATFTGNLGNKGGVVYADYGSNLDLQNNTFDGNYISSTSSGFGGVGDFRYGVTLSDDGSVYQNNSSSKGGVYHVSHGQSTAGSSELTITNATFDQNDALAGTGTGFGGTIYATEDTDIDISNTTFSSNSAKYGGALYLAGIQSTALFDNVTFDQNESTQGDGGAIKAQSLLASKYSSLDISNSTFTENLSANSGGAVHLGNLSTLGAQHGELTVRSSSFEGNTASNASSAVGGAIAVMLNNSGYSYDVVVTGNYFQENETDLSTGALYIYGADTVNVELNRFLDNEANGAGGTADRYAGAVLIDDSETVTLSNCLFGGNKIDHTGSYDTYGGAVHFNSIASLDVYNNIFVENSTTHYGGAVSSYNVTSFTLRNNHFLSNSSPTGSAAYFVTSATDIWNNIFADHDGSAVSAADSTSASGTVSYNDWYQNSSDGDGSFSFSTSSNGNITADPALSNYTVDGDFSNDDWSLSSSSALIDAGHSSYTDTDGSASDIGAFGGQGLLDADGDGFSGIVDCDDSDANTYPGAAENETLSSACMRDADSDGYGDMNAGGTIVAGTDCDDSSFSVNPSGTDSSTNGIDEDCDGTDGVVDIDGDGSPANEDCDDANANIYPGATEIPGDGIDQNCDDIDDCYGDVDGDGYGNTNSSTGFDMDCDDFNEASTNDDCDDADPNTHPGAAENDSETVCMRDADEDGYGDAFASNGITPGNDCNDDEATAYFGATEIVGDGIDQDCDFKEICFEDLDGDGYGSIETIESNDVDCSDTGESSTSDDCDDNDANRYPGAAEIEDDGIDQDCDGVDAGSGGDTGDTGSTDDTGDTEDTDTEDTDTQDTDTQDTEDTNTADTGETKESGCSHLSAGDGVSGIGLLILVGLMRRRRE
ncbi:MAG: MopE-related protein [Myxococcota bacterium]|nr:MopE-related protein [Myxococcota bacterium]